ncbi:peptidoglycan recognition protein [Promicromonospora sukumoe]|uniref:peptidoglycan recognition protein family protein n=1 Tax=Promicromonospora sukumoe TaxID=88382 RepID=UPI00364DE4A0
MARHVAPASRSKQGTRDSGKPTLASSVVGRTVILGVAPALVLGGALAPAATALTAEPSLEPEGASAPLVPESSVLPDAGTTAAQVQHVALVAAEPVAEPAVEEPAAEPDAEPAEPAAEPTEHTHAAETTAPAARTAAPEPTPEAAPAPVADAGDGEVTLGTDGTGRLAGEVSVPEGFQTVGISWPAEIDQLVPEIQVRTRAADGAWGGWSHLEKSPDGADTGSATMVSAPVYVGEAVAVQLATVDVAAVFPEGMELSLVSSAQVTSAAADTSGTVAAASASSTDGPTIITREEWGAAPACADPALGPTWSPAEGGLKGAAIHHTVNPNDYATVAEAMQAIRNDQAYHQQTHGWCDIGYNFLVDKWGNIYEGADGSIDQPIVGAHTGGFNTGTVGVAMVGTYTRAEGVAPTAAQRDGVANVVGFRLARYGVDPGASAVFTAAGHTDGGRFDAGDKVTLPRVFGHRDTHQTECPGELAYAVLPQIQDQAAVYAKQYTEVAATHQDAVRAVYQDMLGRAATSSDVRNWAYKVQTSGATVLSDTMEKSEQYRKARVVAAFRATLGYTPSSTQVAGYVSLIKKGTLSVDEVEPYLLWRSSAYYKQVGGTSNSYVTELYKHILHRTPTAYQRKTWVAKLGKLGRQGVVQSMWDSRSAVGFRVTATYQHYVQITPTAAQRTTWTDRLTGRYTEADLRRTLIGSKTYLAKAEALY